MGERQWGRRADDREPGTDSRTFSIPLRPVPPPEEAPSSRQGRHAFEQVGYTSTIRDLITEFTEAAEDGVALDPSGQPYSIEVLRAHRRALSYVDDELGVMAVHEVRRRHVQGLVTQLSASGLAPTRVLAVVDALGALYSYAIRRDLVDFSPVVELQLPEAEAEDDVASPVPPETPPPFTAGDLSQPSYPPLPPGGSWPPHPSLPPAGTWPPHPSLPPGGSWPPPGFMAPGDPGTPPPFWTPGGTWPPQVAPGYPPGATGHALSNGTGTGSFSGMFGSPGATGADASYDATMQERWLWWTVRIIVIVFVLIALVLVAESVSTLPDAGTVCSLS